MRLGKNQLALLLIVDQNTRYDASGNLERYMVFQDEGTIRYTGLDGKPAEFFIMTRDLRSLATLADRGLIAKPSGHGYSIAYQVTESGRIAVERMRSEAAS